MKTLLTFGLAAFCAHGLLAEATGSNAVAGDVELAFQNTPVVPINVALVPEDEPTVVLQKLVVTDWWTKLKVRQSFETTPTPWLKKALDWNGKKWGTKDYGLIRADFGTWFQFGDRETGAIKERDIYIKVELVRLRW